MKSIYPIPATKVINKQLQVRNVAAYCRVSTKLETQQNSLALQIEYYSSYIKSKPDWNFVGVYADNASGRNTKRTNFKRMMLDCLVGKIDLILIKSISRLGRNTVDLLNTCRQLKDRDVDIFFENENAYLSKQRGELLLTIYAALFQNESIEKSESIKWGIRVRFANGTSGFINRPCYGYRKGKNGSLEIFEPEATVVRDIFNMHSQGLTLRAIAFNLRRKKINAPRGGTYWSIETIRKILNNEKYHGEVVLQKTFVSDFFSGKQKINNGEITRYIIRSCHKQII